MEAFSFSERGWRRYDTKKETINMPMRTCERYDQTTTSRKGWSIVPSQMQKTTFHMLEFEFCVLMYVLKQLTIVTTTDRPYTVTYM